MNKIYNFINFPLVLCVILCAIALIRYIVIDMIEKQKENSNSIHNLQKMREADEAIMKSLHDTKTIIDNAKKEFEKEFPQFKNDQGKYLDFLIDTEKFRRNHTLDETK